MNLSPIRGTLFKKRLQQCGKDGRVRTIQIPRFSDIHLHRGLAMQGANDRTIMALGGWRSPAMLSRYAHLSPTHLWKAVEGLILTGSKTGSAHERDEAESTQTIEKYW